MNNVYIFLILLLFINSHCLANQIEIPPMIVLSINNNYGGQFYNQELGTSKLTYSITPKDISKSTSSNNSKDLLINGALFSNCGESGNCNGIGNLLLEINPKRLILSNGKDNIYVDIQGRVENNQISRNGKASLLNFKRRNDFPNLPWKANLELYGTVDRSLLKPSISPGIYSGTLSIRITTP